MIFVIFLLVLHFVLGIAACYIAWSFNKKFGYNIPGHPYRNLYFYVLLGVYAYLKVVIVLPPVYFQGHEVTNGVK